MEIKEIQEINFLLLKELRRVCDENNIQYFIDSGTLIGAIREKDFIPWDDDADVVFLRPEFEKLKKLGPSVWGKDFAFRDFDQFGENVYFDTLAHLFYIGDGPELDNNPLSVVEDSCEKILNNRVSIDLFILDGISGIRVAHLFKLFRCCFYQGLMIGYRSNIKFAQYGVLTKVIIWVLSRIGRTIKLSTLMQRFKTRCMGSEKSKYVFYSNISMLKPRSRSFLREWWTDGCIDVVFHGEMFRAPRRYHDFLTYAYGDYMTPPSIDEQAPVHFLKGKD